MTNLLSGGPFRLFENTHWVFEQNILSFREDSKTKNFPWIVFKDKSFATEVILKWKIKEVGTSSPERWWSTSRAFKQLPRIYRHGKKQNWPQWRSWRYTIGFFIRPFSWGCKKVRSLTYTPMGEKCSTNHFNQSSRKHQRILKRWSANCLSHIGPRAVEI